MSARMDKRRTSTTDNRLFVATREQELVGLRKPNVRQGRNSAPDVMRFRPRDEDVLFNRSPKDSFIYNPFESNNCIHESIFFRKVPRKLSLTNGMTKQPSPVADDKLFVETREHELIALRNPNLRQGRCSLPDKLFGTDILFNRSPCTNNLLQSSMSIFHNIFQKASPTNSMNTDIQEDLAERVDTQESQLRDVHFSVSNKKRYSLPANTLFPPGIETRNRLKHCTNSTRRTSLLTKPNLAQFSAKQNSDQLTVRRKYLAPISDMAHPSEKQITFMAIDPKINHFKDIIESKGAHRKSHPNVRPNDVEDRDCYDKEHSDFEINELIPGTAEIQTSFCHSKNILEMSLRGTCLKPARIARNRRVYVKFCYLPYKTQKQKSKMLPLEQNIKWNIDVKFKHLKAHQLETGSISIKLYISSKCGFSKKCIAKSKLNLKNLDHRSPNKIILKLE